MWAAGHWERDRIGLPLGTGRWDWQANRYVWIPGSWMLMGPLPPPAPPPPPVPVYVDNTPPPPPAPMVEVVPASRPGYYWVPGAHVWRTVATSGWPVAGSMSGKGYRWRAGSGRAKGPSCLA